MTARPDPRTSRKVTSGWGALAPELPAVWASIQQQKEAVLGLQGARAIRQAERMAIMQTLARFGLAEITGDGSLWGIKHEGVLLPVHRQNHVDIEEADTKTPII